MTVRNNNNNISTLNTKVIWPHTTPEILVVLIFQTVRPENKTKKPFKFIGSKEHEVHLLWLSQAVDIVCNRIISADSNYKIKDWWHNN